MRQGPRQRRAEPSTGDANGEGGPRVAALSRSTPGTSSIRGTSSKKKLVDRAGFEPAYGKPGQIYSLLPLTTRPPVQGASEIGRRLPWRKGAGPVNAARLPAPGRARPWRQTDATQGTPGRARPENAPASGAGTRSPPRSPIPSATVAAIWATREASPARHRPGRSRSPMPMSPISAGWCRATRRTRAWSPRSSALEDILLADLLDGPATAGRWWCSTR